MFVCLHFLPIYQIWYDIMSRLLEEEFSDTKGVIRIGKSKDRQHNGQKKTDKQRSTKHKTNVRPLRTPQKPGVKSGAPEE